MPLPLNFVKEIHSRLAVRYGSAWRSKWADVPQEALEADWASQLDGMQPAGIRKALESLPHDFPPTAPAFRALGLLRDEAASVPALPAPANPVVAAAALGAMRASSKATPAEFMAKLDRDLKAGIASPARKAHHKIATANGYYGNVQEASAGGHFTPPAFDTLPPGMRAEMEVAYA